MSVVGGYVCVHTYLCVVFSKNWALLQAKEKSEGGPVGSSG